jgi:NAD(P)H-nitrite reductase large subunit
MPAQFVLIGSGIAAVSAAEVIRQRRPDAAITMVSEEPHELYSRPGLAYLLRGDVPEKQLIVRTRDDLRALNLKRVNGRVDQLDFATRELVLADGKRLGYDRLLLATGALAVPPPFPGGDLAGVVKLDGLDDCRQILKLARRGRPAVVVGGGITALELAEGLCARRMRVHYFLRGNRYWGDVLDEDESRIVMDRLRHDGVVLHLNTQVKQAVGKKGRVIAVETQAGETVPCEVLAVAIGVRPRVDLARQAGLTVDKGIVVNEFLETSQPGVYAAGDAAQVGKTPLDVLWPTAIDQGRVAGANMAGDRVAYVKGVACNVTMLTGLKVTIIGNVGKKKESRDDDLVAIARGDSEDWRRAPDAWVVAGHEEVNSVRLFVGECTIEGALVMGDQTWSRPLQRLVGDRVDISAIRPALQGDTVTALTRLAEFYRNWEAQCSSRPMS